MATPTWPPAALAPTAPPPAPNHSTPAPAPVQLFEFDAVLGPEGGQGEMFSELAPLATSVLDGYNVCIMAYGQTGSGKTYTMEGPSGEPGVNPRMLNLLFRCGRGGAGGCRYVAWRAACADVNDSGCCASSACQQDGRPALCSGEREGVGGGAGCGMLRALVTLAVGVDRACQQ